MNTFESELKKILSYSKFKEHAVYAGRSVYIQIGSELKGRFEFISLGIANQYSALRMTVLNRIDGTVDSNVIRFSDLFGNKKVLNPNFSNGISPHLWDDRGMVGWYVYHPNSEDYKLLAHAMDEYLLIFKS